MQSITRRLNYIMKNTISSISITKLSWWWWWCRRIRAELSGCFRQHSSGRNYGTPGNGLHDHSLGLVGVEQKYEIKERKYIPGPDRLLAA
jgi:hypothetical protein